MNVSAESFRRALDDYPERNTHQLQAAKVCAGVLKLAESYEAQHPQRPDGGEWTDAQIIEFMSVALRHTEYAKGTSGPTLTEIRQGLKRISAAPPIRETVDAEVLSVGAWKSCTCAGGIATNPSMHDIYCPARKLTAPAPPAVGEGDAFTAVGFRYRVCPAEYRHREWAGIGVVAEWNKPTPTDKDIVEYQTLYVANTASHQREWG